VKWLLISTTWGGCKIGNRHYVVTHKLKRLGNVYRLFSEHKTAYAGVCVSLRVLNGEDLTAAMSANEQRIRTKLVQLMGESK
jgi:hypothetical protein